MRVESPRPERSSWRQGKRGNTTSARTFDKECAGLPCRVAMLCLGGETNRRSWRGWWRGPCRGRCGPTAPPPAGRLRGIAHQIALRGSRRGRRAKQAREQVSCRALLSSKGFRAPEREARDPPGPPAAFRHRSRAPSSVLVRSGLVGSRSRYVPRPRTAGAWADRVAPGIAPTPIRQGDGHDRRAVLGDGPQPGTCSSEHLRRPPAPDQQQQS